MGGDNVDVNSKGTRAAARAGGGASVDIPAMSVGTFYEGVMTQGYSSDVSRCIWAYL